MYPNPVSNQLIIEAKEEIQKITIYNLLGKDVLAKKQVNKTTTIQTSGLQKGVYIVKMTINGKESISKFIKK
ncbi:T9SS type A sorting domain-containing protein [Flavobacterium sp.]|uniref:T9SS type A sorting domain-containing protein n=1 Tax=Flavobacterium sp. TaxID=239 RepID=UPI0038FCCEC4